MSSRRIFGLIAQSFGAALPVEIIGGDRGFYIGTREDDLPFSRESEEYFPTQALAQQALARGAWTQRRLGPPPPAAPHRPPGHSSA